MPYKSDAQRRYMHLKHPEIAARWDKKYGGGKDLPEHVKRVARKRKKKRG